jgi:hypothetical protein
MGILALALLLGVGSMLRGPLGSPLLSLALLAGLALAGHALFLRFVLHMRLADLLPGKARSGGQ